MGGKVRRRISKTLVGFDGELSRRMLHWSSESNDSETSMTESTTESTCSSLSSSFKHMKTLDGDDPYVSSMMETYYAKKHPTSLELQPTFDLVTPSN